VADESQQRRQFEKRPNRGCHPDYTCFALQGPKAVEILEAVTGVSFRRHALFAWRKVPILGVDTIVARQGVTGEVGYEFIDADVGWKRTRIVAAIRDARPRFRMRELGFKAQLVGHTEPAIATVVRDFLPDRFPRASWKKFARLWTSQEELDALDWDITEPIVLAGRARLEAHNQLRSRVLWPRSPAT